MFLSKYYGFGESNLFLLSKLLDEEYKLLEQKGTHFFSKVTYSVGYKIAENSHFFESIVVYKVQRFL